MSREIHLVYHDKCMDGLLGAGILFDLVGGAGLHPMVYPALPDVLKFKNCDVIIVDYIVPPSTILALLQQGNRVFCLDHHIASLPGYEEVFNTIADKTKLANFFVLFNTLTSGAALCELFAADIQKVINGGHVFSSKCRTEDTYTFNFDIYRTLDILEAFHNDSAVAEPEELMCYLSNSDTYSHQDSLEASRHIRLGMEHAESVEPEASFITYLHLYRRYKGDWSELQRIGKEIEDEQLPAIDTIIAQGQRFDIGYSEGDEVGKGEMVVVYAPHEMVNTIAQRIFAVYPNTYFAVFGRPNEEDPSILNLSMRGQNGVNPFNLSQLGQSLEGGGHVNAAGGRIYNHTDEKFRSSLEWTIILTKSGLPFFGLLPVEN